MILEASLTREDLHALLAEALPFTLHVGDPGAGQSIAFHDLREVTLIADVGLRVVCEARVHWPVLGIHVPIVLRSLRARMTPALKPGHGSDVLALQIFIEHADVAGVPTALDDKITKAINDRLAEKPLELSWDFARLLGHVLHLPASFAPLDAFVIGVAGSKLRITGEAFVLAASLHTAFTRHHSAIPLAAHV